MMMQWLVINEIILEVLQKETFFVTLLKIYNNSHLSDKLFHVQIPGADAQAQDTLFVFEVVHQFSDFPRNKGLQHHQSRT